MKGLLMFSLGFILFLIVSFIIIAFIIDKQMDKEFKIQKKKEKVIETNLKNKLIQFCNMFNIPIEYKDYLDIAAGRILYHSDMSGRLMVDNSKIQLLNKYKDEPYVLAHEVGHYIAIKRYQDTSEEMADKMAGEICCMMLSEEEQKVLEISLGVYFKMGKYA